MFDTIIIQPILNALVAIYKGLNIISVPYSFGFAIITLTALIRGALHPFFKQQIDSQKKMNELKPKLAELETKFKDDKSRLQQAQLDLYKEHGINPASGCLFAIVQIPVFIGLYQVLNKFVTAGSDSKMVATINKMLYSPSLTISKIDPNFFIFNLAQSPSHFRIFEFSTKAGLQIHNQNLAYSYYLLIPIITAVLQYFQASANIPTPVKKVENKEINKNEKDNNSGDKNTEKKPESFSDEFQSAMNTQMKYFFPIMIGFFSYTLPVGLSLYWNIFSIFSIMQSIGKKKTK
ncbi:MAG: YidC/Oxa1 family membrane protein insertase [Patescibacteria group bacterium]